MTALARTRRRRTWLALVAGVLAASLVPVAAVIGGRAITTSKAAVNVGGSNVRTIPSTPTAYLATVDDEGQMTSITVFALAPGGAGGTIVSVPVGALVELGSDEEALQIERVGDVYVTYGEELFQQSLESVLNLTFSQGEVVDGETAARYLSPVGSVTVSFPTPLLDTTAEGDVVVLDAGEHELDAAGMAELLLARRAGVPESSRLPYLRVFWDAVADAVGTGRPVSSDPLGEPGQLPPDVRSFMNAVFAGPVSAYQLSATPVTAEEPTVDPADLYRLDIGEVVLVFASVAPSSVVASNPSVSVQLDSAFEFDLTREAVGRLLFVGANVLLVRQVEGPPDSTTVVRSVGQLDAQKVSALTRMLGSLEVETQTEPVEGIEVQVVLGTDFADFIASLPVAEPVEEEVAVDDPAAEAGGR